MTELDDLEIKATLAANRLQRITNALVQAARAQSIGMNKAQEQAALIAAHNDTLARIEEITDQQEKLLQEAGLLPKRD